jgi:hypothetical protein
LLVLVLGIVAVVLLIRGCGPDRRELPPAALLLVDLSAERAEVSGIVAADSPPPSGVRRPRLTAAGFTAHGMGATEYQVVFHGRDGKPLAAYGLDGEPNAFSDRIDPRDPGGLIGGAVDPESDSRMLHFTLPAGTAEISFLRLEVLDPTDVREGEWDRLIPPPDSSAGVALGVRGIGAVHLRTVGGRKVRGPVGLEFPDLFGDEDIRDLINRIRRHMQDMRMVQSLGEIMRGRLPPLKWVHSTEVYRASGDPEETFNVAILGDGFAEGEAADYERWAKIVADSLLAAEPFRSKSDRINIYIVTSESAQSGITDCSDYAEAQQNGSTMPPPPTGDGAHARNTAFGVFGYATDVNSTRTWHGYFDIPDVGLVYSAIGGGVDAEDVDLIVLLANCECDGAAARPNLRIAIVGLPRQPGAAGSPRTLTQLALHEIGHVVAGLGEEYISCRFETQYRPYPNVVRAADAETVWWKRLADVDASGAFVTRYDCAEGQDSGDPGCPDAQNSGNLPPGAYPKVGLYWGAQYIDADPQTFECLDSNGFLTYSSLSDTLSRHYYRPASRCRMRRPNWPWCVACSDTLASTIALSSW